MPQRPHSMIGRKPAAAAHAQPAAADKQALVSSTLRTYPTRDGLCQPLRHQRRAKLEPVITVRLAEDKHWHQRRSCMRACPCAQRLTSTSAMHRGCDLVRVGRAVLQRDAHKAGALAQERDLGAVAHVAALAHAARDDQRRSARGQQRAHARRRRRPAAQPPPARTRVASLAAARRPGGLVIGRAPGPSRRAVRCMSCRML